jgi:hypothetical protein
MVMISIGITQRGVSRSCVARARKQLQNMALKGENLIDRKFRQLSGMKFGYAFKNASTNQVHQSCRFSILENRLAVYSRVSCVGLDVPDVHVCAICGQRFQVGH